MLEDQYSEETIDKLIKIDPKARILDMLELSSFNNKKNNKNFLALNPNNLFPDRKE